METTDAVESDVGLGLVMILSLVTLVGAGAMLAAPTQAATAWGFAVAMLAAALAVVVPHVYGV